MTGVQVRNVGYGGWQVAPGNHAPLGRRNCFVLNDGITRVVVVADPNQAGVTGDGGDNTGVAKFYVYSSIDGAAWTLRATVTPTATARSGGGGVAMLWAASVGPNNDLHLCWHTSTGLVAYSKLTFGAGPTYTVGAEELVIAALPANAGIDWINWIDMDIAGTSGAGNPVVGFSCYRHLGGAGTETQEARLFVRNGSSVWSAQTVVQYMSTGQRAFGGGDTITIACDAQGPVANVINVMAVLGRKRFSDAADLGDVLWTFRMNVSTGAAVSNTILSPSSITFQGFSHGYNAAYRQYMLFSTGTNEWTLIGTVGRVPVVMCAWRFTYVSTTLTSLVPLQYKEFPGIAFDFSDVYSWTAQTYGIETAAIHGFTAGRLKSGMAVFTRTPIHSVRFDDTLQNFDNYNFTSPGPYGPHASGGNNRNFFTNRHMITWFDSIPGYTVGWVENKIPLSPDAVTPARLIGQCCPLVIGGRLTIPPRELGVSGRLLPMRASRPVSRL
jgi:hypothetical protein